MSSDITALILSYLVSMSHLECFMEGLNYLPFANNSLDSMDFHKWFFKMEYGEDINPII